MRLLISTFRGRRVQAFKNTQGGNVSGRCVTLRRIPPVSDVETAKQLRDSSLGRIYLRVGKRYRVVRLCVVWGWRKGFPVYARYCHARALWKQFEFRRPTYDRWRLPIDVFVAWRKQRLRLVTLDSASKHSSRGLRCLAEPETVVTPAPVVFPSEDAELLTSPHQHLAFPRIFLAHIEDATVTGGSNLVKSGDRVICHGLYDWRKDFTSEELHGRTIVYPRSRRIRWLVNDAAPEAMEQAASFVDALAPNYAHWVTEILPRLNLFCEMEEFAEVPLVINDGLHANIMESISAVTGGARSMVAVPLGRSVHVQRLLSVSPTGYVPFEPRRGRPGSGSHGLFSPHALKRMRDRMISMFSPDVCGEGREMIYLRRNSGVRRVLNDAQIESLLVEKGFRVVEPEKLTFAEQVKVFSSARVVVGGTGAALANIVFCRPGARIVIFLPRFEGTAFWYWQNIACAGGNLVSYVFGRAEGEQSAGVHSSYEVDPSNVLDAIA